MEEYAVIRARGEDLPPGVEEQLRRHPDVGRRMERLTREAQAIRDALGTAAGTASDACPVDEALARFLDQADAPGQREHLERHLGACTACQQRLVAMYAELRAVVAADLGPAHDQIDTVNLAERRGPEPSPTGEPRTDPSGPVDAQPGRPDAGIEAETPSSAQTEAPTPERRKRRYLSDTS